MKKYLILIISLLSISFISCVDEEGVGGTSVVEGYVYKVKHPDDIYTFETDTFPASKEDVYIIYGDEPVYGDKMDVGPDGFFRFKYLTSGTYYVYSYSTYPDGSKEAVIDTISIKKGETARTNDIYIHEGKSYGKSFIKGTVLVRYYNKGWKTGLIPAYDVRVYIKIKDAAYHFDEIRTGIDGTFMFQNLDPGNYEVFVITETAGEKILSPILRDVTITKKGVIETIEAPFEIIINS